MCGARFIEALSINFALGIIIITIQQYFAFGRELTARYMLPLVPIFKVNYKLIISRIIYRPNSSAAIADFNQYAIACNELIIPSLSIENH